MRRALLIAFVVVVTAGCATMPAGTYSPLHSPNRTVVAQSFSRALQAAGDDPARYSFFLFKNREVSVSRSGRGDVFYFSDGFAALPPRPMDALMAREVAHEVLGHSVRRNIVQYSITGAFVALGAVVPGLGVIDFVVNPIVVRMFTRQQEIDADVKAVEVLRAMGYEAPRRALVEGLRAAQGTRRDSRGLYATTPSLEDHLAAIGPLEPSSEVVKVK
jgi:Zn-dependent protease with chaperone function